MTQVSRHRLRWWLRGERALGLRYVHVPGGMLAGLAAAEVEPAPPVHPAAVLPPPPQARVDARAVPPPGVAGAAAGESRTGGRPNIQPTATFDHNSAASASPAAAVPAEWFGAEPATAPAAGAPAALGPITTPELSPDEKAAALAALDAQHVKGCVKCPLSRSRRNTVFGEGDANADLMFVGEGPGGTEDATGRPFVGKAGQKLDEMIRAMGLSRDRVYIANVVKCRAFLPGPPPKDRPPQPDEAAACMPYLQRQIELVRPKVIVTLGLSATQYLLGVKQSMSRMRGRWHAWRDVPVMPTFHPSYILRNYTPETRRAVWDDLRQVMDKLKIEPPGRRG